MILAIDPGTEASGLVLFADENQPIFHQGFMANDDLLYDLRRNRFNLKHGDCVAVEMIASYGMAVGREVFETCLVIGRIKEICFRQGMLCRLVYRKEVCLHLCHSPRAKDSNVSQALRDKYGEKGTKKSPGKLYGIAKHTWSALAVADYAHCNPTH